MMARKNHPTSRQIAQQIAANVAEWNAHRIDYEEFSRRNRASWELAYRGELCIIGSACSRRVTAVHRELNAIMGAI